MAIFLVHTETKREFRVIKFDKDAKTVTLQGEHATFEETFDKDQFKRLGYDIVRRDPAEE